MGVKPSIFGSISPFTVLILLVVISVALLGGGAVITMPRHIPINYNEGWNAYAAMRALDLGGGPLYPAPGGLIFNNYPPLSFLIVGAFGWVLGDMIVAGRLIALCSLLGASLLAGAIARQVGASRRGALCAGLLPLLYVAAFSHDYVAMDDPQWLGIAVMLSGVLVFLRRSQATSLFQRGTFLIAAAALMVTGGMIKHNLLAWPLAVTVQLLWAAATASGFARAQARRECLLWLAVSVLLLSIALGTATAAFGPVFLVDLFHHPRVIDPSLALRGTHRMWEIFVLAAVAFTLLRKPHVLRGGILLPAAAVFACALAVLERSGEGVALNAWFESLVVLSILCGVAIAPDEPDVTVHAERVRRSPSTSALLLLLTLIPFLIAAPKAVPQGLKDLSGIGQRSRTWAAFIDTVRTTPGEAGCYMSAVCYWAGRDNLLDVFNYSEFVQSGGSPTAWRALISSRHVSVFVLPASFDQTGKPRPDPERVEQHALLLPVLQTYRPGPLSPDGTLRLYFSPSRVQASRS